MSNILFLDQVFANEAIGILFYLTQCHENKFISTA